LRGQLVLPHGYGQSYPAADGERLINGPRINLLTSGADRDPVAGTPYHKHVRVRLERASDAEAARMSAVATRIHAAA
jgi:anaerobic selenocysteine-containing dehydrogenase